MTVLRRWHVLLRAALLVTAAGCVAFDTPYLGRERGAKGDGSPAAASPVASQTSQPEQPIEAEQPLGPEELAKLEWTAADLERGRRIYRQACAACHGVQGNGEGQFAGALDPRPRDFTLGQFKWRSTGTGIKPLDADLFRTISEGVAGTSMPGWKHLLGPKDRWRVMLHVRTFAPEVFAEELDPELDVVKVPEEAPAPTPQSIARGREVYREVGCATCHGEAGRGDGPSAETLVDDDGFRIRPFDFTRGGYRCGAGARAIYRTFFTGLTGTPMASFEPSVAEEDRWPLVHYVMSLDEPPNAVETLLGIGLDSNRPGSGSR